MTKTTLYGGSVIALLLLGYYAGKSGSDWGGTGFSQLDYARNMPLLLAKASHQVNLARGGKRLSSAFDAEDSSSFSKAPAYDARAHFTVAYWTAVASRLTGSRALASKATAALLKGRALYELPGSSLLTGSTASIMAAGLSALKGATPDQRARGAIDALQTAGSPELIQEQQEKRQASSIPKKAVEALSPASLLGIDTEKWAKRAKWTLILGGIGLGGYWFAKSRRLIPVTPQVQDAK